MDPVVLLTQNDIHDATPTGEGSPSHDFISNIEWNSSNLTFDYTFNETLSELNTESNIPINSKAVQKTIAVYSVTEFNDLKKLDPEEKKENALYIVTEENKIYRYKKPEEEGSEGEFISISAEGETEVYSVTQFDDLEKLESKDKKENALYIVTEENKIYRYKPSEEGSEEEFISISADMEDNIYNFAFVKGGGVVPSDEQKEQITNTFTDIGLVPASRKIGNKTLKDDIKLGIDDMGILFGTEDISSKIQELAPGQLYFQYIDYSE